MCELTPAYGGRKKNTTVVSQRAARHSYAIQTGFWGTFPRKSPRKTRVKGDWQPRLPCGGIIPYLDDTSHDALQPPAVLDDALEIEGL